MQIACRDPSKISMERMVVICKKLYILEL
jgi:hypothetical protein